MFEADLYEGACIDPKTGLPIKRKEKNIIEIVINKLIKSFEYAAEKMREAKQDTNEFEITIKNLKLYLDGYLLIKEAEKELKEDIKKWQMKF